MANSDGNLDTEPLDFPPGWDRIRAWVKTKRWAAREVIYREGEQASSLFAIRRGLVKLVAHTPDGHIRIVRLFGAGSLLGLGGLLHPLREHTAVAVGVVEAECVALGQVVRLGRDYPHAYGRLLESGYAELRHADLWITAFSTGSIRARVARLVNFLGTLRHEDADVELLTCEEMAAVLGVTVESVSRVLAQFKRDRLLWAVRRPSAKLYRRDIQALQRLAGQ